MTTATRISCPNCGRKIKSQAQHDRFCIALHPELAEPAPPIPEEPEVQQEPPEEKQEDAPLDNKDVRLAKLLYQEIVVPICEAHEITLDTWDNIDQSDYFQTVSRIKEILE